MRSPGWRNPFAGLVDAMIAGPGEAPLLALFGKRHDGGCDRPDLDGFPLADYLAPGAILPYSASSGCWWRRCSFCPERRRGESVPPHPAAAGHGGPPRPDRAVPPGADPPARQRPESRASPGPRRRTLRAPPGTDLPGSCRSLRILDFCRRLKDSGCVMLKLGLESARSGGSRRPEQGDRTTPWRRRS